MGRSSGPTETRDDAEQNTQLKKISFMYLHIWIWRERKWTIRNKSNFEVLYSNERVKAEITL